MVGRYGVQPRKVNWDGYLRNNKSLALILLSTASQQLTAKPGTIERLADPLIGTDAMAALSADRQAQRRKQVFF